MTISPSDLPPDARRALLDQLRSQIGDSQFEQLTDRASQDQILEVMLRQAESQPASSARRPPPWWAVVVGKLVLAGGLFGLASLAGTERGLGRALAGAGWGLALSLGFPLSGFGWGAAIGGAVGGGFGTKLDHAVGGAFIGGWAVVLIRLAVEWLAKQAADLTRHTRY